MGTRGPKVREDRAHERIQPKEVAAYGALITPAQRKGGLGLRLQITGQTDYPGTVHAHQRYCVTMPCMISFGDTTLVRFGDPLFSFIKRVTRSLKNCWRLSVELFAELLPSDPV